MRVCLSFQLYSFLFLLISISGNVAAFAEEASCVFPKAELGCLLTTAKDLDDSMVTGAVPSENAKMVKTARWKFGTKQKGFEIYIPLIQKMIGTSSDYHTVEFALALKRWQKAKNYSPANGLLDNQAFSFFKKKWQAQRKIAQAFQEKKMILIPAEYRYQREREASLSLMGEKTFSAYQKMIAAARKDGLTEDDLKIVASNRDAARLKMLQQNVSDKNKVGYSIAGSKSVHFTGRALDLYVGGEPVNSDAANRLKQSKSKAYRWLVQHADQFGFQNYFYEPWHWEYIGAATSK